jgi:hypothetical protein
MQAPHKLFLTPRALHVLLGMTHCDHLPDHHSGLASDIFVKYSLSNPSGICTTHLRLLRSPLRRRRSPLPRRPPLLPRRPPLLPRRPPLLPLREPLLPRRPFPPRRRREPGSANVSTRMLIWQQRLVCDPGARRQRMQGVGSSHHCGWLPSSPSHTQRLRVYNQGLGVCIDSKARGNMAEQTDSDDQHCCSVNPMSVHQQCVLILHIACLGNMPMHPMSRVCVHVFQCT